MKRRYFAAASALFLCMMGRSVVAVPYPLDVSPAIYVDFEYHGGAIDRDNPAFRSWAPGLWSGVAFYVGPNMPSFIENAGVDGHDCLDKASVSWGQTFGAIRYGSNAVGYDNILEEAIDNAWSVTVCGWFKAVPGKGVGGNANLFYRPGQITVQTPASPDNGKLGLLIPAGAGSNSSQITVHSAAADYDVPGEWVFYAVVYDGTKSSNNVEFYRGSTSQAVYLVSIATADAGQLTGGEHNEIQLTAGGSSAGALSAGGYHDKLTVYAEKDSSGQAALDIQQLEKVRRWHLGVPQTMAGALPGDTDLDGDVDSADTSTVAASFAAGPVRDYYWADGDFDGDLDVDQDDVDTANGNFTGNVDAPSIEVAVASNKIKVNSTNDVAMVPNPGAELWAARNEHEGFQLVVLPRGVRIADVNVAASAFTNGLSVLPSSAISIRRIDAVRISSAVDEVWNDPLMEETSGTAVPGEALLFWIDFSIPRQASAGLYQGQIVVAAPDRAPITVPVDLNVWDFNIPIKQNLRTSFNLIREELRNVYGGDWNDASDPAYRKWLDIAIDHRVAPIDMSLGRENVSNRFVKATRKLDNSWDFDFSEFDEYIDYCIERGMGSFNLTYLWWHFWESFYGYDETTGTWGLFDSLSSNEYEQAFAAYIQQAKDHYADTGPRPYTDLAFFYAYDELHPGMPDLLQELVDRHDIIEGIWPELDTLTTGERGRYPAYEDHLDIWVGKVPNYEYYTEPYVDGLRAKGNEVWLYVTGWVPPYCNFNIQEPGIRHRMLFWQTFHYRCEGFLHWGMNVWPRFRVPNPWMAQMDPVPAYDRWPQKEWNDSGWLSGWHEGGGYLLYPGNDGPLSSIRFEQMRDGIEDWEMLNMLGYESSPGNWTGLLARAEHSGVAQSIIDLAKSVATDLSQVVQSATTYTSDPDTLESKRQDIGNAIESLILALGSQKTCDLNQDGIVDNADLTLLAGSWMQTGPDLPADLDFSGQVDAADYDILAGNFTDVPPVISPQAYFPFEGDNGSYGAGSTDNPAWRENISGAAANYVGNGVPTNYPQITADGVKGDAFYSTDPAASGPTMTLNYYGGTEDVFSGVQSYTITGWLNTRDAAEAGSGTVFLRDWNATEIKWNTNGRFQIYDQIDLNWRYSDWGDADSNGEWIFFGITRDSSGIKFYHGDETNAVYMGASVTNLSLGATADAARLILGGRTYNGSDPYANLDMDELRIYSAADDSAALSIGQIEAIRQGDAGSPPPVPSPAHLSIQAGSGSVVISSDDFVPTAIQMLQMSTNLTSGSWSNLSPITGGTTNWVISPLPEEPECFYRVQTF